MKKGFTLIEMLASRKRGFTLIEMLVTIVIITIISAISASSFKNYKSRSYFDDAVSQVHGEVLKAQSLAMSPSQTGVDSYTLTIADHAYTIVASNSADILDSGNINQNVTVTGAEAGVVFNANGSSEDKTITISDDYNKFQDKYVKITPAGSVELK